MATLLRGWPLLAGFAIGRVGEVLRPFCLSEISPGALAGAFDPIVFVQVPQDDGVISTSRSQGFAIGAECQAVNYICMSCERLANSCASRHLPQSDGASKAA